MMLETSLELMEKCEIYKNYSSIPKYMKHLKDEPTTLIEILDRDGLDEALCALSAVKPEQSDERDRIARLFACDCAERTLLALETCSRMRTNYRKYLTAPAWAIEIARRFAVGESDLREMLAARSVVSDIGAAASAATNTTEVDATLAAWSASKSAASFIASDASWNTAWDEDDEYAGVRAADAAWIAEKEWQTNRFREYLTGNI
jgi:hypothetical protein